MITYILQVYRNMQKYKEYNIERKVSKRKRGHAWRRIEHSLKSEDGEEDEAKLLVVVARRGVAGAVGSMEIGRRCWGVFLYCFGLQRKMKRGGEEDLGEEERLPWSREKGGEEEARETRE
jgi:hypothetical protein